VTDPGAPTVLALAELVPDPQNRRLHGARNLALLAESLQAVGAARSIVIDEAGEVLAGNGVVQAARSVGLERVQVVDVDGSTLVAVRRRGLTAEQKRALAIADNRVAELAEWNWDQLRADQDAGLALEPWWTPAELKAAWRIVKQGRTDPDDVPAVRPTAIQSGDLFALGPHRLLCGDARVQADVARLMGGVRAACIYTDPPYGVAYEGGSKPQKMLTGDTTTDLYLPACQMAAEFSDEKAPLYLWHAGNKGAAAASACAAGGWDIRTELVWNKNLAQYGAFSAQYKPKHEPMCTTASSTARRRGGSGRPPKSRCGIARVRPSTNSIPRRNRSSWRCARSPTARRSTIRCWICFSAAAPRSSVPNSCSACASRWNSSRRTCRWRSIGGKRSPGSRPSRWAMRRYWTCSSAYDCEHRWRWTAVLCQRRRRWLRWWR